MALSPTHSISCTNPNCHLPVARIINGALLIESRHNGEKHQGIISLETLHRLLSENISLTNSDKSVIDSAATASRRS